MNVNDNAFLFSWINLSIFAFVIYFAVTVLKRLSEISRSLKNIEAKLNHTGEPDSPSPIKEHKD